MVESKKEYEEMRKQRLEANKKRMEQLNLSKLSHQLLSKPIKKPSPAKARIHRKPTDLLTVRRSSRVANKPLVSYKENLMEPLQRPRRTYSYRHRDLMNRVYASGEVRAYAIDRAEQIQSGLDPEFPSFVKPMLQSHVTGGFWLGLPVEFSKSYLPSSDEFIILEDEAGNESEIKYLAVKTGLSGGWRGFAIDHELVDGDSLVFHLVSPTRFKVYIVRAYESTDDEEEKENQIGIEEIEEETAKENEIEDVAVETEATHLVRRSKRIKTSKHLQLQEDIEEEAFKENKIQDIKEETNATDSVRRSKRIRASRK